MKKILTLVSILLLILFSLSCTACTKDKGGSNSQKSSVTTVTAVAPTKTTSTSTVVTTSTAITEQKAVDIIKNIIGTDHGKRKIEFDHMESINKHEYFVIHAYYDAVDMTSTYGFYDVDKATGEPYMTSLVDDTIIPLSPPASIAATTLRTGQSAFDIIEGMIGADQVYLDKIDHINKREYYVFDSYFSGKNKEYTKGCYYYVDKITGKIFKCSMKNKKVSLEPIG